MGGSVKPESGATMFGQNAMKGLELISDLTKSKTASKKKKKKSSRHPSSSSSSSSDLERAIALKKTATKSCSHGKGKKHGTCCGPDMLVDCSLDTQ